ncbi:heterocyst frequency control protein PatD [Microcoleus sp. FACHB-1515]|uniref:heterocyst frequency control protein PatD n=1 Tax=Cyanophyceae TaxID=3028117 RepID=UPI001686D0FB|nr:heterocyst frequency control protein PatD [Microcoleus sp. FACHB-1515]MBD2090900.1 heterocyst frequency control protein PatD [Microcoleus sp. FACHB-1515]
MSIDAFRQSYAALHQQLEQFQAIAVQDDPQWMRTSFARIQQDFQQIVQQFDAIDLPHPIPACQTEISKQLRLLGMDVMYLQAARLSTTADNRRSQLLDRVEMLKGFCETVLSAISAEPT